MPDRVSYSVRRLADAPIIHPDLDPSIGHNIQGPSLIRAPDWLRGRLGRYYLYFADHKGGHIRLAYADDLAGPWRVHPPGALQLAQSGFPTARLEPPPPASSAAPSRPALSGLAPPGTPGIPSRLEDATLPHIASPDAHVDEAGRRIVLYYHGLASFGVQRTRAAVSADGIDFTAVGEPLGPAYFRVFAHGGWTYALTMPGQFYRSRDGFSDFQPGPRLFGPDQRHSAVLQRGDTLHVFWTRVGDAPERIYASTIDLAGDWMGWKESPPVEVLRPERPWEGAGEALTPSFRSAIAIPVNQLRDPAIYAEDGRVYLLYAVRGEGGVGIAELTIGAA
jgi:hypothetical protein